MIARDYRRDQAKIAMETILNAVSVGRTMGRKRPNGLKNLMEQALLQSISLLRM
jgi:hypothetical protein